MLKISSFENCINMKSFLPTILLPVPEFNRRYTINVKINFIFILSIQRKDWKFGK